MDRIYINEDLTKKELEKGRLLRKRAKEERNRGRNVKVGYNKIIIDNEEWKWNYITESLELIHAKN